MTRKSTKAVRPAADGTKLPPTRGAAVVGDSAVLRAYEQLRHMAIGYEFKPGERLNEVELTRRLGTSRTPLREAFNRLIAEGLLDFQPGKGFFCRELTVEGILSLYELREAVETAAARLAVDRASDAEIDALSAMLDAVGVDDSAKTTDALLALDERFHEALVGLSRNPEMLRVLRNVNARIRFVRWIDVDRSVRGFDQPTHRAIVAMLKARDVAGCVQLLQTHIDRRTDEITSWLKEGYARLYLPGSDVPAGSSLHVSANSASMPARVHSSGT